MVFRRRCRLGLVWNCWGLIFIKEVFIIWLRILVIGLIVICGCEESYRSIVNGWDGGLLSGGWV